jgi:hypothetical protein
MNAAQNPNLPVIRNLRNCRLYFSLISTPSPLPASPPRSADTALSVKGPTRASRPLSGSALSGLDNLVAEKTPFDSHIFAVQSALE